MHSSILLSSILVSLVASRDLWVSQATLGRERSLAARRIAQVRPAILDTLHGIPGCPGEICGNLAGAGTDALLAGADICAQQNVADDIVTASKTFTDSNPQLAAALLDAGKTYRQTEKNTPLDPSTTPPTDQNSVFCQEAPKNAELDGLVQAQSPNAAEGVFFDPQNGSVKVGSQANTIPFGQDGASAAGGAAGGNDTGADNGATASANDGANAGTSDGTETAAGSGANNGTGSGVNDGTGTGGNDGTGTGNNGTATGTDGTETGNDGTGTGNDGTGTGNDGTSTGTGDNTGAGTDAGTGTGNGSGAPGVSVVVITMTNVVTATLPAVARRSQIAVPAPHVKFVKVRRQDTGAVAVGSANFPAGAAPTPAVAAAAAEGDTGAVVVGSEGIPNGGAANQVAGGDLGLVPVSSADVAAPGAAAPTAATPPAAPAAATATTPTSVSAASSPTVAPPAPTATDAPAPGGDNVKTVTVVQTVTANGSGQASRAAAAPGAEASQGLGSFQPLGGNANGGKGDSAGANAGNATVAGAGDDSQSVGGNSTATGVVVIPEPASGDSESQGGRVNAQSGEGADCKDEKKN